MAKEKSKGGKEVRKPKKAKPVAKPAAPGERVAGKVVNQPEQQN